MSLRAPEYAPLTPTTLAPEYAISPFDEDCSPTTSEPIENHELEADAIRYARRWRSQMHFGKIALATGLVVDTALSLFFGDVRTNMIEAENLSPSIIVTAPAADKASEHKATVLYDGFNTTGAHNFAHFLGPSIQEAFKGEQWSIENNNAPLDTNELQDMVEEKGDESGITSYDFVFYSMGDVPGTDNAVDMILNSKQRVESLTYISGPSGYDGLTQATKDELQIAKNLSVIPYIEYTTASRYLAEMYFYRGDIERNPIDAMNGINLRFSSGDLTTSLFMSSQINSISDGDVPGAISRIGENDYHPVINYIKIRNGRDSVVDNDYSSEAICKAAIENNITCNIFEVNSEHSQYYRTVDEYMRVFQELGPIVQQQVEEEKKRYAAKLFLAANGDSLSPLAPKQ